MKQYVILLGCLLILSCKKDAPKPPSTTLLSFPLQNSECTTGVDLNENISSVEFKWMKANHTSTYELRVTNTDLNITQTISTGALSAILPLSKGAPFSWVVLSRNRNTEETATSATWQFYNAGAQTTYAPFPAQAVAPKSGTSVLRDLNNELTLEWSGADVDNDIAEYEVYFETQTPPLELVASPSSSITQLKVMVSAGSTYYWKVLTRDATGNSSTSGIFSFKAL